MMKPALEDLPEARDLFPGEPLHSELRSFEVGDVEEGDVGDDPRQEGRPDDGEVTYSQVLCNDKGRSPHNRRHQLAVGAGSNLRCGGGMGRIADLLHQGDGKRSGSNDVRDTRAGHHAGEPTRYHRRLRRAALEAPEKADGNVVKELPRAELLQHRAEEHEEKDRRRRDIEGNAVNALRGQGYLA